MNVEELNFGLSTVLSLIFGSGGALGVFFLMKGKVTLLEEKVSKLEKRDDVTQSRINSVKEDLKDTEKFVQTVQLDIQKMENRIIKEIHDLYKEQNGKR
jgi:hypothetical protein